jgi:hypothetical protein
LDGIEMIQRQLYKLRSMMTPESVYQIEIWNRDYVVAVNLWTTNGSVSYVARLTAEYVKSGAYEVVDSRIEANFTDAKSIKAAILTNLVPSRDL